MLMSGCVVEKTANFAVDGHLEKREKKEREKVNIFKNSVDENRGFSRTGGLAYCTHLP
jgi:hypothetical protein